MVYKDIEKKKEYDRKRYQENKQSILERQKKYSEENKQKIKAYHAGRYAEKKEFLDEQHRKWKEENREIYLAQQRMYARDLAVAVRKQLVELLGSRCSETGCDVSDTRMFQIHHLNGNADRHVKDKLGRSVTFCKYWLARPEEAKRELMLLCANHHQVRSTEKGLGGYGYRYRPS